MLQNKLKMSTTSESFKQVREEHSSFSSSTSSTSGGVGLNALSSDDFFKNKGLGPGSDFFKPMGLSSGSLLANSGSLLSNSGSLLGQSGSLLSSNKPSASSLTFNEEDGKYKVSFKSKVSIKKQQTWIFWGFS